ncbi:MAG: RNA-binding protein [Polyangiales bacterium]
MVNSVNIVTDRDTGRPRGFAFVEMGSPSDAQAVIDALNGRSLSAAAPSTVNEAREREPRGGGGGGYGGGGGGRGGYGGGGGGYGGNRRY